jgi:thiamine biosynthesis lipoprotein
VTVRRTRAALLSLPLLLLLPFGCRRPPRMLVVRGGTMGTIFAVKIVEPPGVSLDPAALEEGIHAVLAAVNGELSTYREDSILSRFNRYAETDWFPVTPDCARVLGEARAIGAASGGAFDVTVGPLVNLWGFGPEDRPRQVPDEAAIRERMALVGPEKIAVRHDPPAARKAAAGVYCDLSALAKGFGVDEVAAYLEEAGIENYMVEIGGEVRTRGTNPRGVPWRIGVEAPDSRGVLQKIVAISGYALATSGDYRNYFEKGGVRYSHTIDPRTGRPVTHALASVTVIHESCMTADAMATAISVLGPEAGLAFAASRGLPAFMVVREGDRFAERMTPEFEAFLAGGTQRGPGS